MGGVAGFLLAGLVVRASRESAPPCPPVRPSADHCGPSREAASAEFRPREMAPTGFGSRSPSTLLHLTVPSVRSNIVSAPKPGLFASFTHHSGNDDKTMQRS